MSLQEQTGLKRFLITGQIRSGEYDFDKVYTEYGSDSTDALIRFVADNLFGNESDREVARRAALAYLEDECPAGWSGDNFPSLDLELRSDYVIRVELIEEDTPQQRLREMLAHFSESDVIGAARDVLPGAFVSHV